MADKKNYLRKINLGNTRNFSELKNLRMTLLCVMYLKFQKNFFVIFSSNI